MNVSVKWWWVCHIPAALSSLDLTSLCHFICPLDLICFIPLFYNCHKNAVLFFSLIHGYCFILWFIQAVVPSSPRQFILLTFCLDNPNGVNIGFLLLYPSTKVMENGKSEDLRPCDRFVLFIYLHVLNIRVSEWGWPLKSECMRAGLGGSGDHHWIESIKWMSIGEVVGERFVHWEGGPEQGELGAPLLWPPPWRNGALELYIDW